MAAQLQKYRADGIGAPAAGKSVFSAGPHCYSPKFHKQANTGQTLSIYARGWLLHEHALPTMAQAPRAIFTKVNKLTSEGILFWETPRNYLENPTLLNRTCNPTDLVAH